MTRPKGTANIKEYCPICKKPVKDSVCPRCNGQSHYKDSDTDSRPESFTIAGLTFHRRLADVHCSDYIGEQNGMKFGINLETIQGHVAGHGIARKNRKSLVEAIARVAGAQD